MNTIRRVVVATDFSAGAEAAVGRAVKIAQAHGAALDMLHGFDISAWHALGKVFDARRLSGDIPSEVTLRERLVAAAQDLARSSGLEVTAHFGVGEPAQAIASHLATHRAALVVMARRAHPTVPGVGSTLLRVLRTVASPILVVRSRAQRDYERVLCAVDLREVSQRAARAAVGLFPKAEHRLLCVLDPAWEREVWRTHAIEGRLRADHASMHALAVERLEDLARELRAPRDSRVDVQVLDALPVRAIIEQAAAFPADCVAVGRHGQGAWAERMMGSTALDVLHHTAADVLVVN